MASALLPLAHDHTQTSEGLNQSLIQSPGTPSLEHAGKSEATFVCKLIIKWFYSCRIPAHPAPWQQLYPPAWQQRCCSNGVHDSSGGEESQAEPPKRSKPWAQAPPGSCSLMFSPQLFLCTENILNLFVVLSQHASV